MMTPHRNRRCHKGYFGSYVRLLDTYRTSSFSYDFLKGAIATKEHGYQNEVHNEVLHHQIIIVENLSPVLSSQERENRKQEINKSLYEVFKKYQDDKV